MRIGVQIFLVAGAEHLLIRVLEHLELGSPQSSLNAWIAICCGVPTTLVILWKNVEVLGLSQYSVFMQNKSRFPILNTVHENNSFFQQRLIVLPETSLETLLQAIGFWKHCRYIALPLPSPLPYWTMSSCRSIGYILFPAQLYSQKFLSFS